MNKFFGHLKTILKHRRLVCKFCFKCGLYRQGLAHDLSKFSPTEFITGVKYFTGKCSPNELERSEKGYSAAWLHHKGRNKHHFEYWTDVDAIGQTVCVEMPPKYFAEMICDRVAASKVYKGKDYTDSSPLEYFLSRKDNVSMHKNTAEKLEYFLNLLAEQGEKAMFSELKSFVKDSKKQNKNQPEA